MVERPTPRKSKLNARWRSKRRTKSSQRTTAFQKVLLLGRSDVSDPLWLFDTSRYQLITTDKCFQLPVCPVEPTLSGDYVIGSCTSVCSSHDRTWLVWIACRLVTQSYQTSMPSITDHIIRTRSFADRERETPCGQRRDENTLGAVYTYPSGTNHTRLLGWSDDAFLLFVDTTIRSALKRCSEWEQLPQ